MGFSGNVHKHLIIMLTLVFLLLASAIFFLWYKNPNRFPTTAILWTNRPEFAAYAELFNASQELYQIEVVYKNEPAREIEEGKIDTNMQELVPDLVAGAYLNNEKTIQRFSSLASLFATEKRNAERRTNLPLLDRSLFYQDLLSRGENSVGQQILLPVSFDLPALAFLKSSRSGNQQFSLNLESIQEESAAYNVIKDGRFNRMGFSPRWDPEVLYEKTALFQTNFTEAEKTGQVTWNQEALDQAIAFIREWITTVNQGLELEQQFIDTFLYDPPIKLLSDGRILFTYSTLQNFFHLAPEKRSALDFRWMAKNDLIPVNDDILFIGIPNAAVARPAAGAFLLWFFQSDTQKKLLESSQFKRMRTFGIADGFSSLSSINEEIIPQYFPSLVGHIPPENYLSFPLPLPSRWNAMRKDVIIPWLLEKASADDPDQIPDLSERLETWYRQKPLQ
ncbi:hypothetical protein [Sediminispirochaeta smaragdinae]|nr:hypothetical protein [Sediminispirochaeta smaragdinae]